MIRTILFTVILSFPVYASLAQDTLLLIEISSSEEDVEQEGDFVDLNDLELDVGWDNGSKSMAGLFFRDVNLIREAPIQSCYLALTTQAELEDTLEFVIRLEDAAFPTGYEAEVDIKEGRSFLGDGVNWTFPPANKNVKRISPDLTDLVKQLINDSEWNASANLNFIIEPAEVLDDSIELELQFFSYEQIEESKRPQLRMVVNSSAIDGIETPISEQVTVYPNPVRDEAVFELPGNSIGKQLFLYDATGRLVTEIMINAQHTLVSFENFEEGVYYYQVEDSDLVGKIAHYGK